MSCCHQRLADEHFDRTRAEDDLARYSADGPDPTTQTVIDLIVEQGLTEYSLLDIGCGVGVLAHELLGRGASHATLIDESSSFMETAEAEAARRGKSQRCRFILGDFATLSERIGAVDLVTLDRDGAPCVIPVNAGSCGRTRRGRICGDGRGETACACSSIPWKRSRTV